MRENNKEKCENNKIMNHNSQKTCTTLLIHLGLHVTTEFRSQEHVCSHPMCQLSPTGYVSLPYRHTSVEVGFDSKNPRKVIDLGFILLNKINLSLSLFLFI